MWRGLELEVCGNCGPPKRPNVGARLGMVEALGLIFRFLVGVPDFFVVLDVVLVWIAGFLELGLGGVLVGSFAPLGLGARVVVRLLERIKWARKSGAVVA